MIDDDGPEIIAGLAGGVVCDGCGYIVRTLVDHDEDYPVGLREEVERLEAENNRLEIQWKDSLKFDKANYAGLVAEVKRLKEELAHTKEWLDDARTVSQRNLADLYLAREALRLCLPLLQDEIHDDDTGACFYCGEVIESGDEHKPDCKQLVACLAVIAALAPPEQEE